MRDKAQGAIYSCFCDTIGLVLNPSKILKDYVIAYFKKDNFVLNILLKL